MDSTLARYFICSTEKAIKASEVGYPNFDRLSLLAKKNSKSKIFGAAKQSTYSFQMG